MIKLNNHQENQVNIRSCRIVLLLKELDHLGYFKIPWKLVMFRIYLGIRIKSGGYRPKDLFEVFLRLKDNNVKLRNSSFLKKLFSEE